MGDSINSVAASDGVAGAPLKQSALPWKLRVGFVLVPLAHSAGANIITLLAFRFLTDNLAISAAAAGAIFAFVKIYDGILDPALGAFSDRLTGPWGRRLPFILGGGVLMPLAIAMVFNTPDFSSVLLAQIFLTVALLLHATAYTALTIPGMAMLVEASDDYHQRSTLMAYRVFGNSVGVLFGSTLPAWLLTIWGATRSGHAKMSWVVAAVVLVTSLVAVLLLRDAPRTVPEAGIKTHAYRIGDQFKLAWANRPFRILAATHIFVLFGTAITSIGSSYFTKYVLLRADSWLGTYYMISTVGAVGSMPFWLTLAKRIGKKHSYMISMAMFGLLHLSWLLADSAEPYQFLLLRALLSGFAAGGVILCAYSMLSDAVRYDYLTSGMRREGAFAGLTSLIDKLSAAAAIAGMGAYLSSKGYVASKAGAAAVQSMQATDAIYFCFAVAPALAMLLAILTMTRYQLDERTLQTAQS
jgi:glycoside/pentoside/hexuronide:cation symporter, GPH family